MIVDIKNFESLKHLDEMGKGEERLLELNDYLKYRSN